MTQKPGFIKAAMAKICMAMVVLCFIGQPVDGKAAVLYVDDDKICEGKSPCYAHPQDAVNGARPGDTIRIYPGVYGSRTPPCEDSFNCTAADQWAPALIIYKDNLIVEAADPDPGKTIIEATHETASSPLAIQKSTEGAVIPMSESSPNAISLIASHVTIQGLTVRRPFSYRADDHETILIGGLCLGYGVNSEPLGFGENTVRNCILGGGDTPSRNGVLIWHSIDNTIADNTIVDPRWSGIMIYDGWSNAELQLYPPSKGNTVIGNTIVDDPSTWSVREGILVGACNLYDPDGKWTDNSNTLIEGNDLRKKGILIMSSYGVKQSLGNCNVHGHWTYNAIDYFDAPGSEECLSQGRPAWNNVIPNVGLPE